LIGTWEPIKREDLLRTEEDPQGDILEAQGLDLLASLQEEGPLPPRALREREDDRRIDRHFAVQEKVPLARDLEAQATMAMPVPQMITRSLKQRSYNKGLRYIYH